MRIINNNILIKTQESHKKRQEKGREKYFR